MLNSEVGLHCVVHRSCVLGVLSHHKQWNHLILTRLRTFHFCGVAWCNFGNRSSICQINYASLISTASWLILQSPAVSPSNNHRNHQHHQPHPRHPCHAQVRGLLQTWADWWTLTFDVHALVLSQSGREHPAETDVELVQWMINSMLIRLIRLL